MRRAPLLEPFARCRTRRAVRDRIGAMLRGLGKTAMTWRLLEAIDAEWGSLVRFLAQWPEVAPEPKMGGERVAFSVVDEVAAMGFGEKTQMPREGGPVSESIMNSCECPVSSEVSDHEKA